jgi:hypothetical protein
LRKASTASPAMRNETPSRHFHARQSAKNSGAPSPQL